MIPVDQRVTSISGEGDCLMACVASILEIPLDDLPAITPANEMHWFDILRTALRERGFALVDLWGDDDVRGPINPPGYTIAIGPSPRFEGSEHHACVALDGEIVFDPHPTRSGIDAVHYWITLVPVLRSPRALRPGGRDQRHEAAGIL